MVKPAAHSRREALPSCTSLTHDRIPPIPSHPHPTPASSELPFVQRNSPQVWKGLWGAQSVDRNASLCCWGQRLGWKHHPALWEKLGGQAAPGRGHKTSVADSVMVVTVVNFAIAW